MVDEGQSPLTPEEAGAFVTQWAERRKVPLSELASRFEVDQAQAESLLRQARGRLNMQAWVADKRPKTSISQGSAGFIVAALVAGCLLGCLVATYVNTPTEPKEAQARPLPKSDFQVSVTNPPDTKDSIPSNGLFHAGVGALPAAQDPTVVGSSSQVPQTAPRGGVSTGENQDAEKVGNRVGALLGDMTVDFGHHPVATKLVGTQIQPVRDPGAQVIHQLKDMTNNLRTPLPADVALELDCPSGDFVMRGPSTKSYLSAKSLSAASLIRPMFELFSYAINTDIGHQLRFQRPENPEARVRLSIGREIASMRIPWNYENKDDLKKYQDEKCPIYARLAGQAIKGIEYMGPNLFGPPKESRILPQGH